MTLNKEQFVEQIATTQEIKTIKRKKKLEFIYQNISKKLLEEYSNEGWELEKELKAKYKVRKKKPTDLMFQDNIWTLMSNLGFKELNRERQFKIPYGKEISVQKQVDVFAKDDETVLIIECKSSEGDPKKSNFKTDIEAIGRRKQEINQYLKKVYGNKLNIAYIFATKNYYLSEADRTKMENFKIHHFEEESYAYYSDLSKHLGTSARYQMEANLFHNQTIYNLGNKVPAIQGRMGGHTYYAFSLEPEKLLKIGYVLHRNKANIKLMPTYQRLIKRSRLKKIRDFINNKGFFPNSIVCSIESNGKDVNFEPANTQVDDSLSKVGILHLPKKYRSMYVVDGQHRLYGYSDSDYREKNTIPVVAFLNLSRSEQVKLFMEINENQKAVPKNLRLTLESDLNWSSSELNRRINALKSEVAARLGEELCSPLYNRVIVGENAKSEKRVVSLKSIIDGFNQTNFFGSYKGNKIIKDGVFYLGENDCTYDVFFPFICSAFQYIKDLLPKEWNKGPKDEGIIVIPVGITAFIRLFGDILDHLIDFNRAPRKIHSTDSLIDEMAYYLDPLSDFFENLSNKDRTNIRKTYGSGGPVRFARIMQRSINKQREDFEPEGLKEYWINESKQFNTQSFEMIRDIESHLRKDFSERLNQYYGQDWMKQGLPRALFQDLHSMAADKNYNIDEGNDEKTPWDCLHLIDYKKIFEYGSNWSNIFQENYTRLGDGQKKKSEKISWLDKLNRIRNENFHEYSVKPDEFDFIKDIHDWLIKDKG